VNEYDVTFPMDLITDLRINTTTSTSTKRGGIDKVEKALENLFKITWISKCVNEVHHILSKLLTESMLQ
jgi:hypothetical protein